MATENAKRDDNRTITLMGVTDDANQELRNLLIDATTGRLKVSAVISGGSTDNDAIHDNVSGEISAITEKSMPVNTDLLLIEDSADSNSKKKIQIGNLPSTSSLDADKVNIQEVGTATYNDVQDWINITQSAGKFTGGDITDNGDGTVTVAAGTGFIKITDSDVGVTKSFDWSANNSVSLTDNSINYIYVEYNSGNPQITSATSVPSDKNTNIVLGIIYREGTTLHIITAGQVISNYAKKTLWKDIELNGKFQRVNGIIISETGTRNIALTAGSLYAGLTKVSFSAFDSSGTDTFTYYYRDGSGGWTKVTGQSQIDNIHYDDGSGTLAELSNQSGWRKYYGVHWVYATPDGCVFVVYGQDDYLLSDAENAQPPSDLPDIIESIGGLVGKIIIEKNASSFESVESAFNIFFVPHAVVNHNELSGLQGGTSDEYYHLTEDEHTEATQYASGSQNGLLSSADWTTFNGKMDDLVDDTTPQLGGDLDCQNKDLQNIALAEYNAVYNNGNSGTSKTINWNNGNKQKITLTGNCTFTFTAPSGPCSLQLIIAQDGTGSRTITWPSSVKWVGGSAPTLTTDANAIDIVSFLYDGTNYYGTYSLDFS